MIYLLRQMNHQRRIDRFVCKHISFHIRIPPFSIFYAAFSYIPKKNVFWHISTFLCNREFQGISYYTKKHRKVFIFTVLFFLIICRIIFVLTAPLASPLRCLLPFHPPQSLPD